MPENPADAVASALPEDRLTTGLLLPMEAPESSGIGANVSSPTGERVDDIRGRRYNFRYGTFWADIFVARQ